MHSALNSVALSLFALTWLCRVSLAILLLYTTQAPGAGDNAETNNWLGARFLMGRSLLRLMSLRCCMRSEKANVMMSKFGPSSAVLHPNAVIRCIRTLEQMD